MSKNTNRGDDIVARARRKRQEERELDYKPNKRSRHVWSLPEYSRVLVHTEGFTQSYAQRLLRMFFSVLQKALLRGDVVVLPGIGRIYVLYMAPRGGGECQAIPDAARLMFRTSATIQRMIRPRVKYYVRFNDQPVPLPREDSLDEITPTVPEVIEEQEGEELNIEEFVVAQGWEDESGQPLED